MQKKYVLAVDTTAWTPTGSWTSNVTYTGLWRRIGSRGYYEVKIALTGTPTPANLTINLPTGHVIDTNKLLEATAQQAVLGVGDCVDAGTTKYFLVVKYNNTGSVLICVLKADATYTADNDIVTQAVPQTFANNDIIILKFDVPIVGWS